MTVVGVDFRDGILFVPEVLLAAGLCLTPFDPAQEQARFAAAHPQAGGVVSFLGQVRQDGQVQALELQHYAPLTLPGMQALGAATMARWPLDGLLILHRSGVMLPGEPIVLSAGRDGQDLWMEIRDHGPGIPADERDRIFDMFYSVERGDRNDRSKPGTGLGLSICQGMVAAHGGTVKALPGADGRGATIRIVLPLPLPPADAPKE